MRIPTSQAQPGCCAREKALAGSRRRPSEIVQATKQLEQGGTEFELSPASPEKNQSGVT